MMDGGNKKLREYKRLTITQPDGKKIWRMVPEGWTPVYSPDSDKFQPHDPAKPTKPKWPEDMSNALEKGITEETPEPTLPTDPKDDPTDPEFHKDKEEEKEEDAETDAHWLGRVAKGIWKAFKVITGISTWEEAKAVVNDPNLSELQKSRAVQVLAAQCAFDLIGAINARGLREVKKVSIHHLGKYLGSTVKKVRSYMGEVTRNIRDFSKLQGRIIREMVEDVVDDIIRVNRGIGEEVKALPRTRQILREVPIRSHVENAKAKYLEAVASKTERPPNDFIAVIGSRTYSDDGKVHRVVKQLLDNGYGITSGGAEGADHFALTGVLRMNPKAGKIYTVGTRHHVNQKEVDWILALQEKGGTVKVGAVRKAVGKEEYNKALFKRSDDMVNDESVKGVMAFVDPMADNKGTWHTVIGGINKGKRVIVHTTDEKVLDQFWARVRDVRGELDDLKYEGYWHKLKYNSDAYQWINSDIERTLVFVDKKGDEILRFDGVPVHEKELTRVKEVVKKIQGSPTLLVREDGRVVHFPKHGAQLQDFELLKINPSTRTYVLTKEGKKFDFIPLKDDPTTFQVKVSDASSAIRKVMDRHADTNTNFPKALRQFHADGTVEVRSVEEAIRKSNPSERPRFTNDLDRMIWEEYMNSKGTMAFRTEIADEPGYRQLVHIMTRTKATPKQANELRKAWDVLGDTPELYRFYYKETEEYVKTALKLGYTREDGINNATSYFRKLADELEKVTKVDDDALDRVLKTYRETDILGFDDVLDDYERTADILGKGDPIQIDMEDFKIGEEVGEVIRWVPLLETKEAETPWLELQPEEFQNLVKEVQKATKDTLGEIGQRIKAMKDQFTKPQKDVLFTEYRIKKHKIYKKVERKLRTQAEDIDSKIKKARSKKELASLGKFMYTAQKEGTKKISDIEWTILWQHYNKKKERLA